MRQVDFSADILKRDAIVKAFKVRRTVFFTPFPYIDLALQHAWAAYGRKISYHAVSLS